MDRVLSSLGSRSRALDTSHDFDIDTSGAAAPCSYGRDTSGDNKLPAPESTMRLKRQQSGGSEVVELSVLLPGVERCGDLNRQHICTFDRSRGSNDSTTWHFPPVDEALGCASHWPFPCTLMMAVSSTLQSQPGFAASLCSVSLVDVVTLATEVRVFVPGKYRLEVQLPKRVSPTRAEAKWVQRKSKLVLTLPID